MKDEGGKFGNLDVLSTVARRGIGPWAGLAALILLGVHLAFRPWTWTNEWQLVAWQYAFSVVMLGPMVAGFTAWEVSSIRRQSNAPVAAGKTTRSALIGVLAVYLFTLIPFAGGAIFVVAFTIANGPPGSANASQFLPFLLASVAMLFFAALGAALGWRLPFLLTAPAVAATSFGAAVVLYGTSFSFIVDVGGSSGSLVGLAPNIERQVFQIVFFAVASVALIASINSDAYQSRFRSIATGILSIAAIGVGFFGATENHERLVPDNSSEAYCITAQSGLSLCVGPGYKDRAPQLLAAIDAPLAKLRQAGIDGPSKFDQRPYVADAEYLDINLLEQGSTAAAQTIAYSLVPPDCDFLANEGVTHSIDAMSWWLSPMDSDRDDLWPASQLPAELLDGDLSTQDAWARTTALSMSQCAIAP